MSISNITTTVDAVNWPSIQKVAAQTPTAGVAGSATDENLLVIGTFTVPNNAASIFTLTRCLLALDGAGNRLTVSGAGKLNLVDSMVRIGGNGASRVNETFTGLTRTKVIGDRSQAGQKFVYTLSNANIQDAEFISIYVHELSGNPTTWKASYTDCGLNVLNWANGDMNLTDITLGTTSTGFIAWLGAGSVGNRFRFRDCTMAFTTANLAIQSGAALDRKCFRYWSISEQLLSGASPVQDAVIIYRSDQTTAGVQAEISRYTSDANGRISGGKHYQMVQYIIDSGTSRSSGLSDPATIRDYTIATVSNFREIRSYGHNPLGNVAFNLTSKNGDSAAGNYVNLYLIDDAYLTGISYAAAGALAATHSASTLTVTGALTLVQLYASRKAYWRLTDGVLFGSASGDVWDLGALNVSSTFALAPDAKLKEIKTSGSITLTSPTVLRYSGTGTATITDAPENATFDGMASFTALGTFPASAAVQNSAQGLRLTVAGTYDLSAWTFSGNTADVTIAASTGTVTVLTGGRIGIVINDLALGATFVRDDNVDLTVTCAQPGASLLWRNVSLWTNWLAEYANDATAQAANLTPAAGDYYRTSAGLYGRWTGSAWVTGVADIDGGYYASTYLGGPGMGASAVLRVPPSSNIRLAANWGEFKMTLKTIAIGTSATSTEMVLQLNPDIDPSYFAAALPIAAAFEVSPPSATGTVTVGFPASSDGISELLALAVLELIRDTKPSMSGAITLNSATLIEVSLAQVIFKDDTVLMVAASTVPNNTIIQIPLSFTFQGYTIDPNPLDIASCTRVMYDKGAKNPTSATKILGRVAIDTADKAEIKNHVTAMNAAF